MEELQEEVEELESGVEWAASRLLSLWSDGEWLARGTVVGEPAMES